MLEEEELAAMTWPLLAPEKDAAARETTIPWMAAGTSDGGSEIKT